MDLAYGVMICSRSEELTYGEMQENGNVSSVDFGGIDTGIADHIEMFPLVSFTNRD